METHRATNLAKDTTTGRRLDRHSRAINFVWNDDGEADERRKAVGERT